jgi:hypothetical protein
MYFTDVGFFIYNVSGGIFGSTTGINNGNATAQTCVYNGTYDTNTTTYGQLAGLGSINITPTNIIGYLNYSNNIIGNKNDIITIGYDNNGQIYYSINGDPNITISNLVIPINIIKSILINYYVEM